MGRDRGSYDGYDRAGRPTPPRGPSRPDGGRPPGSRGGMTPPGYPGGNGRGPSDPRGPGGPRSIAPGGYGNGSSRRPMNGPGYGQSDPRDQRGHTLGSRARDLSRSMSRQLSAMARGAGRVARREAQAIANAGARPQLPATPPPGIAEMLELPIHRRSRIRLRARKWRLSRVRQNPVGYFAVMLSAAMLLVAVLAGGSAGGVYAYNYYGSHKGQIAQLYHSTKTGGSTVIYDRNGQLLYTVRNDNGFNYYRPLSQISALVQKATLDTEDHTFYSPTNIGIDFQGTARALLSDLTHSGQTQGGSTITQQLVKNLVLRDTRQVYERKLNEIILAIGVNNDYTKANILEMYLNTIDYGDQNQGIEAAARNFFGIKPGEKVVNGQKVEIPANTYLTLPQVALLVGLPNAPTLYLPTQYTACKGMDRCPDTQWDNPCVERPDNPQGACTPNENYDYLTDGHEWQDWMRARDVLDNMVQYGDITQAQRDQALQQVHDILLNHEVKHWAGLNTGSAADTTKKAPHFVDYVEQEIYQELGVDPDQLAAKGWTVYTTLDLTLDEKVASSLQYYLNGDPKTHTYTRQWYCGGAGSCTDSALSISANAHNGAVVAIDPRTGDILAMVGSVNYGSKSKHVLGYNNVTVAPRQLGSSVKPVVYSTAFQMGWTPATIMQDQPICFPIQDSGNTGPTCKGWYSPHNYEAGNYAGRAPLRENLANSLNVAATEALSFVGGTPDTSANVLAMANRLGIKTWKANAIGPTTALGDQNTRLIDLTSAFGTFANGGKRAPYRSILMIKDADGNVIYPTPSMTPPDKAPPTHQVLSPQAAYMITSILTDNNARAADFGSDNPLYFGNDHPGIEIAAKTGTASGHSDNSGPSNIVTVGYSPYLTIGVWVGNSDGGPDADMTPGIIGVTGAGYVFHDVMEWSITHYKWPAQSHFPVPQDMARGTFNCTTGLAPYKDDPLKPCPITGNKNLYSGFGSGAARRSNTDWYIQGQVPGVS
jgi:membrane peptidoglycan carboxypeptidase